MSSSNNENWWVEPAFALLCIAAVIAAVVFLGYWVLFGILWMVPYALFTVIPWAGLTAAIGFGLCYVCTADFDNQAPKESPHGSSFYGDVSDQVVLGQWESDLQYKQAKKKLTPRSFHPRRLIIAFPALVFLALMTVYLPTSHQVVTEKVVVEPEKTVRAGVSPTEIDENGNPKPRFRKKPAVTRDETRIVFQWPWLVGTFNQVNSGWQDLFPDTFLKQGKPYEFVLFDRNVISVVTWIALLLTGPVLFWILSEKLLEREERDRVNDVDRSEGMVREMWDNSKERWKKEEAKLNQNAERWYQAFQEKKKEVELLQAKLTFTPEGAVAKAKEVAENPGVLDSDLL